ncbi:class I SAM-dependent methyltransferase [Carnobacteriaceae bacterium 52-44]
MDHYYSSKPSSESKRERIEAEIAGHKFSFITDAGVFSKNHVDVGSEVLMTTASKTSFPEGNLLDVGCGYGPVGLYLAAAFPGRHIEMVDMNERALDLARDNAKLNEIESVEIYQSDLFENVENHQFAGIISNPPIRAGKKVVHQILEEAYDYLAPGGLLQIVIQKKQGAPSARKKMEEVFGNVERVALEKGYWILESKK